MQILVLGLNKSLVCSEMLTEKSLFSLPMIISVIKNRVIGGNIDLKLRLIEWNHNNVQGVRYFVLSRMPNFHLVIKIKVGGINLILFQ